MLPGFPRNAARPHLRSNTAILLTVVLGFAVTSCSSCRRTKKAKGVTPESLMDKGNQLVGQQQLPEAELAFLEAYVAIAKTQSINSPETASALRSLASLGI